MVAVCILYIDGQSVDTVNPLLLFVWWVFCFCFVLLVVVVVVVVVAAVVVVCVLFV